MAFEQWAMVFPGQGSQSVGMLSSLAERYPIVQTTFAEASDVLGYDLWQRVQTGPADLLDQTIVTQPAVLAADIAVWRILQAEQIKPPHYLAGHSLGEWSALVCAEVLPFAEAVALVQQRAQAMQEAVPVGVGAMGVVIGLNDAELMAICEEVGDVSPANLNSVGQIVVAGKTAAVDTVLAQAKVAGARLVKHLPVSVPSHCFLMIPAAAVLERTLANVEWQLPKIPIIHNVDVSIHRDIPTLKHALLQQLSQPVRWVETIRKFKTLGAQAVIECGPGAILSGLNKRITTEMQYYSTDTLQSLQATLTVLSNSVEIAEA